MATLSNDELNVLNTAVDSSDFYSKYFGEMELPEKEIEGRIELANKFETIFFWILALILADSNNNELQSNEYYTNILYMRYRNTVSDFYKRLEADSYIDELARRQSELIVYETMSKIDDAYYSSEERAINISANETNGVANYNRDIEMIEQGKTRKIWHCKMDGKERKTHKIANGQTVLIRQPFKVGDSKMLFPHDKSFDADDKEIIHCRCVCKYI